VKPWLPFKSTVTADDLHKSGDTEDVGNGFGNDLGGFLGDFRFDYFNPDAIFTPIANSARSAVNCTAWKVKCWLIGGWKLGDFETHRYTHVLMTHLLKSMASRESEFPGLFFPGAMQPFLELPPRKFDGCTNTEEDDHV
jgi:hypothetical protein